MHDQSYECYLLKFARNRQLVCWSVCTLNIVLANQTLLNIREPIWTSRKDWLWEGDEGFITLVAVPVHTTPEAHVNDIHITIFLSSHTHSLSNSCHLILGQFFISNSDPIWSLLH